MFLSEHLFYTAVCDRKKKLWKLCCLHSEYPVCVKMSSGKLYKFYHRINANEYMHVQERLLLAGWNNTIKRACTKCMEVYILAHSGNHDRQTDLPTDRATYGQSRSKGSYTTINVWGEWRRKRENICIWLLFISNKDSNAFLRSLKRENLMLEPSRNGGKKTNKCSEVLWMRCIGFRCPEK